MAARQGPPTTASSPRAAPSDQPPGTPPRRRSTCQNQARLESSRGRPRGLLRPANTGRPWAGRSRGTAANWLPRQAGHQTPELSPHKNCLSACLAAAGLLKEQGHSSSALLVNSGCCENWSQHNPLSSAHKKVLLKCKILENVSTITRLRPLQC